jgi:hypothetical protein
MNENWEHRENKMEELKIFMYHMLLHTLDERLPKGDNKMQEKHENVEEIKIESHNHDYSSLKDPYH